MIEREKCDFVTNLEDSVWVRENLIHMTGSKRRIYQGNRNYMVASIASELHHEMEEMVKLGLVVLAAKHSGSALYRATEKGCDHIGMTKAGKKRALKFLETD